MATRIDQFIPTAFPATASPGALPLGADVPAGANICIALLSGSDDAGVTLNSLASNFTTSNFTLVNHPGTTGYGAQFGIAQVNSTGSGKTLTPVWSSGLVYGPTCALLFVNVSDPAALITELSAEGTRLQLDNSGDETPKVLNVTATAGDLVFQFDTKYTTSSVIPGTPADYTSLITQADLRGATSRLSQKTTVTTGTNSGTTVDTSYNSLIVFVVRDIGGGDVTAPTLTSPTGTKTGSTTATGTVSTNEANGTLYRLASTNSTELASTVIAAAQSQAVTATGTQNVTFTGLTASTTYYAHYVHVDAASNQSARVSSTSFTTDPPDSTAPTLTSPTGTPTGTTTSSGTVSTNEANGTLYHITTTSNTATASAVKAGTSQAITSTGTKTVTSSGLTAATTYYNHFLHRDAAGNDSAVSTSAAFTTAVSQNTPEIIGSPTFILLGTSATPGAQAVTVPAAAKVVVVHLDISGYPTPTDFTSISSTFTSGGFTVAKVAQTAASTGSVVAYATVTSTGAGTITPVYAGTNGFAQASMHVYFLDKVTPSDFVVDIDFAQTSNGTTAATAITNTVAGGLVVIRDIRGSSTAGGYPSLGTGYTNIATNETPLGANTYYLASRLKRITTPTTGTASVTTEDTFISSVGVASFKGSFVYDAVAPTLTSATGTQTGSTTASGSVSTDEANGTLYRLASTNATESAATVIAAALTTAVTTTGVQNVTFTGLSPSTTYYAHYVHVDAAGNQSTRVSSSSFTTTSGDVTAPTLTSPTGTQTGGTTASGTVSTNEANGTLYRLASTNSTELAATVVAANLTQAVSATGVQNVTFTGLSVSTTYYAHYVHIDSSGNQSTRVSSASFTTTSGDVTAPTLTSPTGTTTGTTTASGSVSTNEANGTLYRLASTNSTELASTVIAANLTSTVTTTGVQNVTFTGLTPSTGYYAHYVHVDSSGNQSTRVSSTQFTTATPDTTAPTLTSPTGTQTGGTTASGSVSTDEANGTLYRLASTAATPSAATVIAAALTTTVTTTGVQNVTFTGLTSSTVYYAHYVHVDAAGNQSTRVSSAAFTTADITAPTLTSPTGTQTGSTTASGTVSTNEANGTLYRLASTAATPSAATVIAAALTQSVTATGTQNVTFTGLTPSTTYYAHYVHVDAAGNQSTRVSSTTFTTLAAAPVATITAQTHSGQTVTVSGTYTSTASSGTVSIAAGGVPNGAVSVGPSAATVGSGTFSITFTGMVPGNYAAPAVSLTGPGGVGNTSGVTFSILGLSGTPQATL